MAELTVELLAGLFTLTLFLIIIFYLIPHMKKEYQQRGWSWKHYYQTCGDDNRQTYRNRFLQILKK